LSLYKSDRGEGLFRLSPFSGSPRVISNVAILTRRMTQNESDVARLMLGFTDGIVSPVSDRPRRRKASRVDPVRF
jgi:hypothetical protein